MQPDGAEPEGQPEGLTRRRRERQSSGRRGSGLPLRPAGPEHFILGRIDNSSSFAAYWGGGTGEAYLCLINSFSNLLSQTTCHTETIPAAYSSGAGRPADSGTDLGGLEASMTPFGHGTLWLHREEGLSGHRGARGPPGGVGRRVGLGRLSPEDVSLGESWKPPCSQMRFLL